VNLVEQGGTTATLGDVAHAAGVSRQTVSNVLNFPHRVRPETRQRVNEAISALGYRPNRAAQALRQQASRMIGYRIEQAHPESLASIHDRFLHALAAAGQAARHQLLLFTADDPETEVQTCERLYRSGTVDGFVMYGIDHGDLRPGALLTVGAPFAAFGRTDYDTDHAWVDVDNAAGTAAAVDHLVGRGHRRIAFIGWPEGSAVGDRRARGWREAMARHGLLTDCHHLDLRGQDLLSNGARLGGMLLNQPEPPTALVAVSDTLAVGAWQACRDAGQRLAIVGFDDTPTAAALDMSSVRQPIEAVGRAIMHALLARLPAGGPTTSAGAGTATNPLLNPTLVVRASSAAPLHT